MLLLTWILLFPLNIFRANNVDHLHVAISGVPRQLVVTELILLKTSQMLLEIRSSCPVVSSVV